MNVVFAYIPVIHKQALEFLKKHQDKPIWLLDNEVAKSEYVFLERDARALPAAQIKTELAAHGFNEVIVVTPSELKESAKEVETFIIPEDAAVRYFLETYAPKARIETNNIFIRWTQQLSTAEHEVPPDRIVTSEAFAQEVITHLEKEAAKSPDWWRQIAAGVVKEGKVVATAFNEHFPTTQSLAINGDPRSNFDAGQGPGIYTSIHAEAAVIAECAKDGETTAGADIYVTTFPCPTCARSIIKAGFRRVFYKKGYSILDAEEILKGEGVEIVLVTD